MSLNSFTFDGQTSTNWGVYISGSGTFNTPNKEYSLQAVPGRNGDLVIDQKRFENIEVTYPAFIKGTNFRYSLGTMATTLLSRNGYCTLTDTYHPNEFRQAIFRAAIEVEPTQALDGCSFELVFECKPQRFLTSGTTETTYATGTTQISNPGWFPSKPLIKVYGARTVNVGGTTLTVTEEPSDHITIIDCDLMECYSAAAGNRNEYVTSSTDDFPEIPPGTTNIIVGAGSGFGVKITPRWWIV